jgi:transcriptional regulator with XRE-family HTH domain
MWTIINSLNSFAHTISSMVKNSNAILEKFGTKVRQTRLGLGLSQEKLAERAGLHRTYIGMIERAEKNVTLLNISKIAFALEVSICDLLDNKE